MAEAVITVKLSPAELRTVGAALDYYVQVAGEAAKAMHVKDGQALRAQVAQAATIRERL